MLYLHSSAGKSADTEAKPTNQIKATSLDDENIRWILFVAKFVIID